MEADILPVSAVLVAGPDSAETLCGSPAVQGDNVRTLAYACGYDIVSSLGTVQSEVVAVAYPCNISLQGSDSANFYLFLEITKQVPGCFIKISFSIKKSDLVFFSITQKKEKSH